MNGHESFLIKQRVFCEVGSCFRYASRVIKIEGHETVFCHQHPYDDPEPTDLTESMETDDNLSGGQKIQDSPRGWSPSQFPSIEEQANYWEHCCDDCDEIEQRMREEA